MQQPAILLSFADEEEELFREPVKIICWKATKHERMSDTVPRDGILRVAEFISGSGSQSMGSFLNPPPSINSPFVDYQMGSLTDSIGIDCCLFNDSNTCCFRSSSFRNFSRISKDLSVR